MLFLDKQFCVCFFLGGEGGRAEQKKLQKKTQSPQDCAYILENHKIWAKGLRPTQFPLPNYEPVHFGETSKVGLGSTKFFSSIFGPGNHSSLGETFLDSPRLPCKLWTYSIGLGPTKFFTSIFGPGNVGHTLKDLDPPSLAIHSHLGETSVDSPRFPCKLWTCSLRGNPQGWTRAHQAYPSFDKTNGPWCSFIL